MLYIWHMPLHFILWHAIKLLQPINQNQSIRSLFVTCHKYLLQPIKSTAQIWVVNIISMEFLHFLKSYLEGGLLSGGIMKCRFFSQAIKVICSTCMLFFFQKMLTFSPNKRIVAKQAIQHEYFEEFHDGNKENAQGSSPNISNQKENTSAFWTNEGCNVQHCSHVMMSF